MKVYDSLQLEGGVDREVSEYSMEMCMAALRAEYTRKGGCDNAVIGRILSPMAYMGASKTIKKHAYRT